MLPGRSSERQPLCRDCAGIATALTCTRCYREAERFRAGLCIRCALHDDLQEALKPGDDLRLHRLVALLTGSERPESIYTYMRRGTKARSLLEAIGDRRLALNHDAFDQLPHSRAVEHLRALLTHHRMMPDRGNETLVRFRQWLATRIADLPDDGTSQLIERYAAWQHLKRIRAKATDPETNL
ncbi:recombinase XerD, partial [Dietzia cercidiphylli]|nr:recombinase XerD [Dietzia cercidiphylli]